MTVINWPKHLRVNCKPDASGYLSDRCAGGQCYCSTLFMCARCGGVEGSLPTDCPGDRMTAEEANAVYEGDLNFIRGPGWVRPGDVSWRASW